MNKLFTILMLIPILLFGQRTKNNVYAEAHLGLFTQGVMNYERLFSSGDKVNWYSRLGAGWGFNGIGGLFESRYGVGGLGAITMITGKRDGHFELNMGAFIGDENGPSDRGKFLFPILNIGYRYQKPIGGFIFRANAGFPSLGISFGYAF